MAPPARARAQDVKPAAEQARAPDHRAAPAARTAAATSSRLPSPQVAAAILEGATKTPKAPEPTTSTKKAAAAPTPIKSDKSPAVVRIERSAAPAATAAAPRAAAPLTLVPKPGPALGEPAALKPTAGGGAPVAPAAKTSAPAKKGGAPAPSAGAAAPEAGAAPAAGTEPGAAEPTKADEKGAGDEKGEKRDGKKADVSQEARPAEGAAPEGSQGGGAGGGPAAVKLHMPEPPTEASPATKKRIRGVQGRAGHAASAKAAMPGGAKQVGDARSAVDQPPAEAKAHAYQDLVKMLGGQAEPSPAIVEFAQRIRKVIREKRPPDEDALMEAKPEAEAMNAGGELNSSVQGETKKVQDNYGPMDHPPEGAAPAKGQDLPPQPGAAATPGVNARSAAPDPVPDKNVSLDKDADASKKKMQDAGMDTAPAQLVQGGPIGEARGAQGELEQAAKEDPAKVLAGQKEALAKAEDDMAALQQQALEALTASRASTSKRASSQQRDMVGSEESRRAKVSAEAQQVFTDAQKAVDALLKPLASNAINEWEAAKTLLVAQFKADLKVVQDRVNERHSGVGGWFVGVWDAVAGLPGWAEDAYNKAEYNFSEGVIAKITEISVKVNTVIKACEKLIKDARDRIAQIFTDAKATLGDWAVQEQAKFDGQLDKLRDQAYATRDNFNKDLIDRSAQAVDEVRAEISELRKKAGGLVGRIANAINRFLDDPVKFIIEGLLEILGIPPASFWAVVAKIKKVVKDIADDPMKFANNLMAGLAQGFSQFFDNILSHLLKGFLSWLTGGLGDVGVQLPKDLSLKSIITFFLQLMGITWPRIRKILAKHVGEKNVALLEKVYSLVSFLIEKGPEGIFEMIREKLDPQTIVDQVIQLAVDYLISAVVKAATARILMLFNPAGAIFQALEAIYRVLKWIFQNAARIFTLIETVVNGIADILAGSIGGFANAVEKALGMLIAPVIAFIADYLGFGDLPSKIADKIKSFQEMVLGIIEKVLVFLIEKGKALLAAIGIGGKDKDKKDEKAGTPHEQAVHEVATTLAEPPPGKPLDYDHMRALKEQEAEKIVATRNQSLAAEHVKLSVTFKEKKADQADHDLDFSVRISPNDAAEDGATPVPIAEPIAGLHVVTRPDEFKDVPGESHHVPAKGLGSGIGQFLVQVADGLRKGEWAGDPAGQAVADEFAARGTDNSNVAAEPGKDLSAILVRPEGHTDPGGVHTVEGSGPVLLAISENPRGRAIVAVKRKTQTKINGVASYLAVNPQIPSWRLFIADVRRALSDPGFRNQHNVPPSTERAVDLILNQAEKEFMDADEASHSFLNDRVVARTNAVLDRAVGDGYKNGKATIAAAMDRANDGTPEGRRTALSSLDGHFGSSWAQFRRPIRVTYPPAGGE